MVEWQEFSSAGQVAGPLRASWECLGVLEFGDQPKEANMQIAHPAKSKASNLEDQVFCRPSGDQPKSVVEKKRKIGEPRTEGPSGIHGPSVDLADSVWICQSLPIRRPPTCKCCQKKKKKNSPAHLGGIEACGGLKGAGASSRGQTVCSKEKGSLRPSEDRFRSWSSRCRVEDRAQNLDAVAAGCTPLSRTCGEFS